MTTAKVTGGVDDCLTQVSTDKVLMGRKLLMIHAVIILRPLKGPEENVLEALNKYKISTDVNCLKTLNDSKSALG